MGGTKHERGRSARRWGALALAAATVVGAACGSSSSSSASSSSTSGEASSTTVPTGGTVTAGAARGKQLYEASCASCHGQDLRGTDKGPSHLSQYYEESHHSDASFKRAIAQGSPEHHWCFGDMKPVPGLSEQDVNDIIAYVRKEQRERGTDEGTARC